VMCYIVINELSIKKCYCERSVATPIFFKAKTWGLFRRSFS